MDAPRETIRRYVVMYITGKEQSLVDVAIVLFAFVVFGHCGKTSYSSMERLLKSRRSFGPHIFFSEAAVFAH